MSSGVRRFWSFEMVMDSFEPAPLSSADTRSTPLTSISKVTSICGTPRGAGGMFCRSNLPSRWLSFVMGRSPSKTWIVTVGWLSWAVEKIWDFLVGTTEFRGISLVITPPTVSIPSVSGLTSRSTMSPVSSSPPSTPPWTAAPYATASSGLIPREGSLPLKNSLTSCCTLGIRVEPPTSTISSTSFFFVSPSSRTRCTGLRVPRKRSMLSSSKRARVSVSEKSSPSKKDSISIRVWCCDDSVRLAFSTSRRSFWTARLSPLMFLPFFFLYSLVKYSITRWSKSSPPRWVSPLVESTSKTPWSIVRSDTSKVPPPRSNTSTVFSPSVLSRPYAIAAAVGSLMIRITLRPAMAPASLVAWRWASLE
mmetsp:Transcript_254/g.628  ORF Transcript_254/g.628 Transcript_254/m.628 type:complete len:364 (-) Transcript_254:17-1108(-)